MQQTEVRAQRASKSTSLAWSFGSISVGIKNNLLGVKGVGELGTIGATPATVSAVADALQRAGHGDLAPVLTMPLTPARMWQWLQPQA